MLSILFPRPLISGSCRYLMLAATLMWFVPSMVHAQEFLEELDGEIAEVASETDQHRERLAISERRLGLLKKLRSASVDIHDIELAIEHAEQRNDDRTIEALERRLQPLELTAESMQVQLELLDKKSQLLDLDIDIREAELESLQRALKKLQGMLREGEQLVNQLFKLSQTGEEAEDGEVEAKLHKLEDEFETLLEITNLKVALHFAQEEEDDEAIEEITEELRFLEKMDENLNSRLDPKALPTPIIPSEQEIAVAANESLEDILPVLKKFCFDCHDSSTASGDLDLQRLVGIQPLVIHRRHWLNIKEQLKVGSMPPAEEPQPGEPLRRQLIAWLTHAIDHFDYETVRGVGYEGARRLTHAEYNHTIRELFGMDLRPADQFPDDLTASSGFENREESLFIQPITMERYIGAAERIVRSALPVTSDADPSHIDASHLDASHLDPSHLDPSHLDPSHIDAEHEATWQRILSGREPNQALEPFVTRAFRRPIDADEMRPYLEHFRDQVKRGAPTREAFRDTLAMVLVSPKFLIRSESDRSELAQHPFRISQYELASRLSYFLWASMPDRELFRLAESGELGEPAVLRDQVDRMLDDKKATTLGRIFASQWLGFANLDRVSRDQIENPWATDSLFDAMHEESAMLFNVLVRHNEPVERLIDADYTFVNEELARHYRLEGVQGTEMRRVSLEGSHRGGILGHASILAITSFPGRTSPVVRGNWILSTLLGTPPPPPPPNVSEFDERISENHKLTQKQKLALHRSNPNCYACHSQIDPLGFALERFEWYGRYRPDRRGRPIDATGQLPSGRRVNGLDGLRQAIIEERLDDLVEQLTRKMLSYALGRQLHYDDEATVIELVRQLNADGRRMRRLIHSIVQSHTFQMKQLTLIDQVSSE